MPLKVNGKVITAKQFVWEGCHKIYLINSEEDLVDAANTGYTEPLPISDLQEVYEKSCGLRFISNWDMTRVVSQFEDAVFEYEPEESTATQQGQPAAVVPND